MSPSSIAHGGQYDTKYVTFEYLLHAAFVADEIWGFMLECLSCLTHDRKKRAEKVIPFSPNFGSSNLTALFFSTFFVVLTCLA